VENSLGNIRRA